LRTGHRAAVIWLTGVPASGKTTIARSLEQRLFEQDYRTMLLDGDDLRHGLCRDLGYSPAERAENIRRAGEVARLFFDQGSVVLCAFVSPYRADRAAVRALFPPDSFIEAFVTAPLGRLMRRDPKGLYAKAGRGDLQNLTGVSAPYEPPAAPEIVLNTDSCAVADSVDQLWRELEARGILRDPESPEPTRR
jgi:bifunctional enzyme CysN/CysC